MALRLRALGACLSLLHLCSLASAQNLATITPCPACPSTATVPLITVTSQLQPVSTCSPVTNCFVVTNTQTCTATPSCSTYSFISTVITNGGTTQTITSTDQPVTLTRLSTVLTLVTPCPTSTSAGAPACTPTTSTQTVIEDNTVPYNNLGPNAIPGFPGSGLCVNCQADASGNTFQPIRVNRCVNGVCTQFDQILVSRAPTSTSSTINQPISTATSGTAGVNVFGFTTTIQPNSNAIANGFTAPVSTVVSFTTSLALPGAVTIIQTVTVTVYAAVPAVQFIQSLPSGSNTLSISNGNIVLPNNIGSAQPNNANVFFGFGSGLGLPAGGIISLPGGVTISPAGISINQAGQPFSVTLGGSNAASTPTGFPGARVIYGIGGGPPGAAGANGASPTGSATPSAVASIAGADLVGCFRGPGPFVFSFSSGGMSNDICIGECKLSGFAYSGVSGNDCYCSNTLSGLTPVSADQCAVPCAGNPSTFCGAQQSPSRVKRQTIVIIIIVYFSDDVVTSSTTASATTEPTPDPSSDPDVDPIVKRDEQLRAGLVALDAIAMPLHSRHSGFRSGGQLHKEKEVRAEIMVKRDFGLRQPFQFV